MGKNSNSGSVWSDVAQGAITIGGGLIGGAQGKKAQKGQHGYILLICVFIFLKLQLNLVPYIQRIHHHLQ